MCFFPIPITATHSATFRSVKISADYIRCTDTGNGATPPVINLGDEGGSVLIGPLPYPKLQLRNSDCHWSFQASDPNNVIQIEVVDWDVSFENVLFAFR